MGDTGISWTDATWNCVRGCSRVSTGCKNCYAEQQAARIVRMGRGKPTAYDGLVKLVTRDKRQIEIVDGEATGDFRTVRVQEARWTGEVTLDPKALQLPLRWKKPRRIFVNSMSDLFHEKISNEQIAAVFGAMAACPQHTFQVLTKRARRMREWFAWVEEEGALDVCLREAFMHLDTGALGGPIERATRNERPSKWPLANVWLGVSVEDQAAADERIPELLRTPAAVRFLSCEPLLGEISLPTVHVFGPNPVWTGPRIDWVIAGCESGPSARPCDVAWLRSLRDQCAEADVAFFLKQAVETTYDDDREDPRLVGYSSEPVPTPTQAAVLIGDGSRRKPGGVIELPYLDGVQHAAFPGERR